MLLIGKNFSNASPASIFKFIFFDTDDHVLKKILLVIGLIEEMRTNLGNKEVP